METVTLIQFLVPLVLLVGAYFIGTLLETKHYRSLRTREHASRRFLTVTFPYEPDDQRVLDATLVTGSIVVSVDYFKRFIAGLRMIFGGRVTSYESLLDRARREAILRMQAEAHARGFNAVVNVRLETSRLASSHGNNQGTAAVEILAFGTAVKFERQTSPA